MEENNLSLIMETGGGPNGHSYIRHMSDRDFRRFV